MFESSGRLIAATGGSAWLDVLSDAAIAGAWIGAACVLGWALVRRHKARSSVLVWIFLACALAFGVTHLVAAMAAPGPAPFALGLVKPAAAVLCWLGLVALITSLPQAGRALASTTLGGRLSREIAQRKRTEEKLRQSEDRFRTIFHNTTDVITYVSRYGKILDVNEGVEEVFGYKRQELVGKHFVRLGILRMKDIPKIVKLFRSTTREGNAIAMVELELKAKNGQSVFVEVGTRFIRHNGRVEQIVNIFRDMTERKRAVAELTRAKRAAEAANGAKSEFLANISHEIRTPMTAILGFADVLLGGIRDPEHLDAARTIKRNGEHLLGIIHDILDLSRMDTGRLQVCRTACSPARLISDVASLMLVRAAAKNLRLRAEYDGPIPETIQSDPIRLRQILVNLLSNAIKFTETGQVRLVVGLSSGGDRQTLRFDVIDTGVGMNQQEASQIFEPFTQLDNSTHRKFGGTGLGLTLSKRLAGMLGGDVTVSSVPGKGSTFRLSVDPGPLDGVPTWTPPSEPMPEGDAPRAADPQVRLQGRILLAEDGPDNQRLIAFMLKKAGAEVMIAENGRLAVEKALAVSTGCGDDEPAEPFDVVLMDMQMPVMDGYEATRCLRREGYTRPVIALTAHAMSDDRQKCLDAGCDDYLAKPIDRARLIETVASHLARPRPGNGGPLADQGDPSDTVVIRAGEANTKTLVLRRTGVGSPE